MREVLVIEKWSTTERGRTVVREWKYCGRLDSSGGFHLLGCCGKRCVLPGRAAQAHTKAPKVNTAA